MNLSDLLGPILKANPEPLHPHKIILWGRDDLLVFAIGSFLKNTEWDVVRVSNNGDIENLMRETKRVNPEVVILCQYKDENAALALRLIDEQRCLKVITLSLDSNHMQVYSKENILLRGVSDLLFILEKGNFSDCTPEKEAASEKNL